jgi:hypothetical protein
VAYYIVSRYTCSSSTYSKHHLAYTAEQAVGQVLQTEKRIVQGCGQLWSSTVITDDMLTFLLNLCCYVDPTFSHLFHKRILLPHIQVMAGGGYAVGGTDRLPARSPGPGVPGLPKAG